MYVWDFQLLFSLFCVCMYLYPRVCIYMTFFYWVKPTYTHTHTLTHVCIYRCVCRVFPHLSQDFHLSRDVNHLKIVFSFQLFIYCGTCSHSICQAALKIQLQKKYTQINCKQQRHVGGVLLKVSQKSLFHQMILEIFNFHFCRFSRTQIFKASKITSSNRNRNRKDLLF